MLKIKTMLYYNCLMWSKHYQLSLKKLILIYETNEYKHGKKSIVPIPKNKFTKAISNN